MKASRNRGWKAADLHIAGTHFRTNQYFRAHFSHWYYKQHLEEEALTSMPTDYIRKDTTWLQGATEHDI